MPAGSLSLHYRRRRGLDGDPGPPLEDALAELVAAARAAWPGLAVSDAALLDHLAALPLADADADDPSTLRSLRADDLLLACACRLGDPAALRAFTGRFGPMLRACFAEPSASGVDAADLQQILLQRLFVGEPGRRPKIYEYTGRGTLHGWLKVVALRLRIDSERRRSDKADALPEREAGDALLAGLADDPEVLALKSAYREVFRAALVEVLADLEPHERNLLRQSVVHGLSATDIARLHDVHRSTVKRWLAALRGQILERTGARMMAALRIDHDEVQSAMRLLQSRLEISFCRHLGEP